VLSSTLRRAIAGDAWEELTIAYLVREFKRLGLEAADKAGNYVQVVPMTAFHSRLACSTRCTAHDRAKSRGQRELVERAPPHFQIKDSPLVFVGYGVQAPEFQWDDYKGLDLHGKTLVMLINDPPIPDRSTPGSSIRRCLAARR